MLSRLLEQGRREEGFTWSLKCLKLEMTSIPSVKNFKEIHFQKQLSQQGLTENRYASGFMECPSHSVAFCS
jgi:hypothetical protein